MKKNYFRNLCIKDFTKSITNIEKSELERWLDHSEENKKEYKQLNAAWKKTKPNQLSYEINIDDEWDKFNKETTINHISPKSSSMNKIINAILKPKLKPGLAFGSLMVVIISLLVFNNLNKESVLKSVVTGNGERLEVLLSDGSVINMNSGSEINYLENFDDDKREIKLKGEAFFSIKKDGRPFIIKTDNAITRVLGTKFNVWARENKTRVVVKEGRVSLSDDVVTDNKVILVKNQTSVVVGDKLPLEARRIDADYRLGWLEGKIVFSNTELNEVIDELERYYNKSIDLEDESLNTLSLTGTFDNEKIDSVLSKICLALNLKYLETHSEFKITK